MNRRDILSLSAITALGLGLRPGNAVAQQSDTDKVKAALDDFHAALSSLDIDKMDAIWAHDADAMLINPRDKSISVGWDAIKKNWEATFNVWSELKVTRTGGPIHVSGNIAWATGIADVVGKSKTGTAVTAPTFESSVFEKRGERWLLVSHSAWRVPQIA
jgi:ketosteroid isomerase-like protein